MSKKADTKAQLDRIEAKLDEVLAFRDWLQGKIGGLLGGADQKLSGVTGMVLERLARNGGRNGD
jgi:hypothetical protein